MLVIVDVGDPTEPREAGRWWLPGQKSPEEDARRDRVQQASFSNPVAPTASGKLSRLPYLDPGNPDVEACRAAAGSDTAACGNTHAAKRLPSTDLLIVSDEYFTCPYGHVRIVDVADPARPRILSHYLTPENTACDPERPRRPADAARLPRRGPSSHIGNPIGTDLYLMAWYGNGLQVIDLSDPRNPVSAGHCNYRIDTDLGIEDARYAGSDTYDVIVGPGGRLYVSDGTAGLRVLRYLHRRGARRQTRARRGRRHEAESTIMAGCD